MKTDKLTVKYHNRVVGTLSLTPDDRLCAFEYDNAWLSEGFSISPLELPLKTDLFIAKAQPFHGNFGIFEDSLPDGYGRYLLHKALLREGINDTDLSALDRLSIVRIKRIKDLAAAAVLVSAITAAVIGLIVFIPKIIELL